MDMQAALAEYLAPVKSNPSITNEQKALIESHVRGFVDFMGAKDKASSAPIDKIVDEPVDSSPHEQPLVDEPQGVNA